MAEDYQIVGNERYYPFNPKVPLPCRAYILDYEQVGPDCWADKIHDLVVWQVFEDEALISRDFDTVQTINIGILKTKSAPKAPIGTVLDI